MHMVGLVSLVFKRFSLTDSEDSSPAAGSKLLLLVLLLYFAYILFF